MAKSLFFWTVRHNPTPKSKHMLFFPLFSVLLSFFPMMRLSREFRTLWRYLCKRDGYQRDFENIYRIQISLESRSSTCKQNYRMSYIENCYKTEILQNGFLLKYFSLPKMLFIGSFFLPLQKRHFIGAFLPPFGNQILPHQIPVAGGWCGIWNSAGNRHAIFLSNLT